MEDEPVEFLKWRVDASGQTDDWERDAAAESHSNGADPARYSEREAYFGESAVVGDAYRSDRLVPGQSIAGPAFIDDENTTIVLPPDSKATVTADGNYHIQT
jgi:N-methylhydantoinase A